MLHDGHCDGFGKIVLAPLQFALGSKTHGHVGGSFFGRRNGKRRRELFADLLQLAVLAYIALDAFEPVG